MRCFREQRRRRRDTVTECDVVHCRAHAVDVERQKPNVFRMKMLGATVVPVQSGARTLKDAMNEALRDWVTNVENTFYIIGTVAGPHPYPMMVRDFQSVIGREARAQMIENGGLPDAVFACVGGGSNAIGMFHGFLADRGVKIFGVEAGGRGDLGDVGREPEQVRGDLVDAGLVPRDVRADRDDHSLQDLRRDRKSVV